MNNSLIDIITGKERKRYNQIIQLIDQKNYSRLFYMDRERNFGLSNQKYIDRYKIWIKDDEKHIEKYKKDLMKGL